MKTVGIAMLFGLCSLIGIRLADRRTKRLEFVRALQKDLRSFAEWVRTGSESLSAFAAEQEGELSGMLKAYLAALAEGETETTAAERATERFRGGSTEQAGMRLFLSGLSSATRADLILRTQRSSDLLERTEREAEEEAKQARVLRISGVLIGAGLAILLI